jgi:hypothetical protein
MVENPDGNEFEYEKIVGRRMRSKLDHLIEGVQEHEYLNKLSK